MWTPHKICRVCHGNLKEVFSFGMPMPLANDFKAEGEEREGYVPLDILWCGSCQLAQTSAVVSPHRMFSHYSYTTSTTQTMLNHFSDLWKSIQVECAHENVVEIGSNNGDFLKLCKQWGAESVLGIDPAENLRPAKDSGIIAITGFFDASTAAIAHTAMPVVNVVVAANVFAHIPDWHAFIKNLDLICNKDTLIVLVVGSQLEMLKKVQFDSIYHEHLSYVSIRSIQALLEHTPFHIHKVETVPLHGGSLVIMLRRNDCGKYPFPIPEENITVEMWSKFENAANLRMDHLTRRVNDLNLVGKKIAGYGAPAKSTVWVNACGFTSRDIAFCMDGAKEKQGKLIPGTDIPILPERALVKADTAIVWAHNFFDEIVAKNKDWLGTFINPHAYVDERIYR